MKKFKNFLVLLVIAGLLIGLYNAMLFIFNQNYETSFWVSYGFITAAQALLVFAFIISGNGKFAGKVLDISIVTLASIYLTLEFIMGTIFMIFPSLSFNVVFFPQMILLTFILIVFLPALILNGQFGAERKEKTNGKRVYHYMQREADIKETVRIPKEDLQVLDNENETVE